MLSVLNKYIKYNRAKILSIMLNLYVFSIPFEFWDGIFMNTTSMTFILATLYLVFAWILGISKIVNNNNNIDVTFFSIFLLAIYILIMDLIYYRGKGEPINYTILLLSVLSWVMTKIHIGYSKARIQDNIILSYIWGHACMGGIILLSDNMISRIGERAFIMGSNPNGTGFNSVIALTMILYMIKKKQNVINKYLLFLSIPLLINVIIITASKGAVISLFLSIFIYIIFKNITILKKITYLLCLIVCIILIYNTYGKEMLVVNRIEELQRNGDKYRNRLNQNAISVILDNPIMGSGTVGYYWKSIEMYGRYFSSHNMYMDIMLYSGIFGMSIFIIFLYKNYYAIKLHYMNTHDPFLIQIFIITLFNISKSGAEMCSKSLWLVFVIILSIGYNSQYSIRKYTFNKYLEKRYC